MSHKVSFIKFYHSYQWLNNSIPHLSEKSNFAVSIVWNLDCANLIILIIIIITYINVSSSSSHIMYEIYYCIMNAFGESFSSHLQYVELGYWERYFWYDVNTGKVGDTWCVENDTFWRKRRLFLLYLYRATVFCQKAPILPSFYRATVFWLHESFRNMNTDNS